MALTQRHHWLIAKIVSAFEPDIDNIKVCDAPPPPRADDAPPSPA